MASILTSLGLSARDLEHHQQRTGSPSFNVTLDLTGLNDGPVTVTALATDGAANTRRSVQTVNNNSGGTLGDYDAFVAYVSPTGDDGTGEVNNRSLPFATIAAAQAAAA
jgi:hypothetical protein